MPIVSTSTSAFFDRARANMKNLRAQAETLQTQLGSGQKLARSSDDPVAASRLRALSRLDTLSQADTTNASRANNDLTLADSAMSEMSDAIIRAQELATQAASTTLSDDQRGAIGDELNQIHGYLLTLANARDSNGNALFGGQNSGDAYSLDASGNAVYIGTGASGDLPIGEGLSVSTSLSGPDFLNFTDASGNQTDVMATIKLLADALKGASTDPTGAAKDALTSLQSGLDTLSTAQTVVGTRLAWIDLTSERRTDLSELRTAEESELGATDIATTVTQLQETLTVLEASQASFSKLASLSLFDKLG
ncbi:flagellar hook-associated protein 3 FlgL [Novosphingobium sp. CF614]|uniref:flagellin N-terminal helical domain-containing protein n=1 Tax=Novosphingobium sp. CF614 TaxID=1884364 RepID=UPI0008F12060|nr:flagellar biosynthesis protein FlgL [Novosphingobium sp. CF614]SFF75990.1 flagellar hook-associated protein 3 FlgL [Novosphingobium sp. CF614]